MKFKGTLIWALVLVALAAFVYIYEIKGGEKRQQAAQQAKKVFVFQKEDIQQLTLKSPLETIICQRTEDGWKITEPVDALGDQSAIDGIINTLQGAEVDRVVNETGEGLAQFGLDPAQATLEMSSDGAPSQILHLGHNNPTRSHAYARREGQPEVFLTSSSLLAETQKKVFDLRDKRVLSFSQNEVTGLTLAQDNQTIEVERGRQGWELKKPLQVKGDNSQIESMLRQLQNARAKSFVEEHPEDLSIYGLDRPELAVVITLGPQGSQKRLLIGGSKDGDRYAQDVSRDPVFLVPESLLETMNKTVFDLREKKILDFQKDRVTGLELASPERTIVCQKDTSNQWQMVSPETTAVDQWELESILSSLLALRAESFVSEDPEDLALYGLSPAHRQAILMGGDGPLATLRLGRQKGDQVYACDASGSPVCLVDGEIVETLSPTVEKLKKDEAPDE